MKHRTKRMLILLYTGLTLACVVLVLMDMRDLLLPVGFVWPEILALAFVLSTELTTFGVAIACASGAGLLLHLAAPVCGCLRVHWPFKVLLCVKAVLSLAAFLLVPGWYSGLFLLLHAGMFVLTMIFFGRGVPEAAPKVEITGAVPGDVRLHPLQTEHADGGGMW